MGSTTEVVFLIDRSGSMAGQEDDVIGGFNAMLEKQRRETETALLTTVLFHNRMCRLHDRLPLGRAAPLTGADYCVGGSTALLDAIGETILHIKHIYRYAREEDRPAKTLFIIMTDGQENASRRFRGEQIRKMVREQEEAGWEFLFIGAEIDAVTAAEAVGIRGSQAFQMFRAEDHYTGCFDAMGDVIHRVSVSPGRLQDDDWDILERIFSRKKKRTQ